MTAFPSGTNLLRQLAGGSQPARAWVRRLILLAVDWVALLTPASPDPHRVVVVRTDNIGDFVVWFDAARALAEHYRRMGMHVALLANSSWSGWAEEFGVFDEVISMDENRFSRNLRYRLRFARRLRGLRFGVAVRPAFTRVLGGNEALVRLSGARERTGPAGTFDAERAADGKISDRWYTRLLRTGGEDAAEMERAAALVRALTGRAYEARIADLRPYLPLELPASLRTRLNGGRYFVIFPGATFAGRLWPAERYAEIADELARRTGWTGVICGGAGESSQAQRMCAAADVGLVDLVGKTSLTELASVLAGAEVLVANETSAVHIAAAVGTPSVCVLGGGHYGRFVPYPMRATEDRPAPVAAFHGMACYSCDWKCSFHPPKGSPVPCIESVSVADVWRALERAMPGLASGHPGQAGAVGEVRGPLVLL